MARHRPSENGEGVVVVEFEVSDSAYPFVKLSEDQECGVTLVKILPRGPGRYTEFFEIDGASIDAVRELFKESQLVEPNLVVEYDDSALIEFVVSRSVRLRTSAVKEPFRGRSRVRRVTGASSRRSPRRRTHPT